MCRGSTSISLSIPKDSLLCSRLGMCVRDGFSAAFGWLPKRSRELFEYSAALRNGQFLFFCDLSLVGIVIWPHVMMVG